MNAPATHDPVAVTTADGTSWVRRAVTQDGRGLYAVDGSCSCPEFLMATLAELAEHGIQGMADALPMPVPVVPEPQALSVEQMQLRVDEVERAYTFDTAELKRRIAELRAERADRQDKVAAAVGYTPGLEWSDLVGVVASNTASLVQAERDVRALRARIAELEALTPAAVQTCRTCGAGYTYGEPCSSCEFRMRMAAELQARGLDGEHYPFAHHDYRVGHDLPETGGAR